LTEDDDGELILSKEDEEFRIVYDKKTKKKLSFKTKSKKLKEWIKNINDAINEKTPIDEALSYAVSIIEDEDEDDFGEIDDQQVIEVEQNDEFVEDIELVYLKKKMETKRRIVKK